MRGYELTRRLAVFVFPPALGQCIFLLRIQQRKLPDLIEIAGKPTISGQYWKCSVCHHLLRRKRHRGLQCRSQ